jgi:hypothetical protein
MLTVEQIGGVGEFLIGIGTVGSWITSIIAARRSKQAVDLGVTNGQKIDQVHELSNGLSKRNEEIAEKLVVEKGKAAEKANPT